MTEAKGYRPDIDGLRAFAVLAVIGFHAFPGWVPHGYLGVDVFFVISGFLITGILTREPASRAALARFYGRRVRRLLPALLVVLLAVVVAGFLLMRALEFQTLGRHVLASLFFVQNFNLAGEAGYFDMAAKAKPLLHLWSLAVEEQFYLVWPLLLLVAGRWRGWVVGAVLALSLALMLSGALGPDRGFYWPVTRAWELAAGAALALGRPLRLGRFADPASVTALLALAAVATWGSAGEHAAFRTVAAVAATTLLIASGPEAAANRLLALKPAVAVGLISYPLYLWHWPLLAFPFLTLGREAPDLVRAALMALAVALAWLTWRFLERPLRFRWPAPRAVVALLAGLGLLAGVVPAAVWAHGRLRGPVEAQIERQLSGPFWRYTRNAVCERRYGVEYRHFCFQSGEGEPTVLLVGNSYANHFTPGFATAPEAGGGPVLSYGACDPSGVYGPSAADCRRQEEIARTTPSLRLIVVSGAWPRFDDAGRMIDHQTGALAPDAPDARTYEAGLTRRLRSLAESGRPVVVFGPKVELGYDIEGCFPRPLRQATRSCRVSRAEADAQIANTLALIRRAAAGAGKVAVFDQTETLCGPVECRFVTNQGLPLLRDNGHYSELGSQLAVRRFFARPGEHGFPDG